MLKTIIFGISLLFVIAGLTGTFLLIEKTEQRNYGKIVELISTENQRVEHEIN